MDSGIVNINWFFVQRKNRNVQIRFRYDSKEIPISSGTKSLSEAKKLAATLVGEWFQNKSNEATKIHQVESSLTQAYKKYLSAHYAYSKPNTKRDVERSLQKLITGLKDLGIENFAGIEKNHFEKIMLSIRDNSSPKYFKNILTDCRKFLRWALEENLLEKDPTKGVKTPPRHLFGRRENIWTEEEFQSVSQHLSPIDAETLLDMKLTGMDSCDIFEMKKSEMMQDESGHWKIVKKRKKAKSNYETIDQPISKTLLPRWKKYWNKAKDPDSFLFDFPYSNYRNFGDAFRKRVKLAWKKAELEYKDLKSLRHSFTTYHVERGVPVDVLRKWLGHSPDSRTLELVYEHRQSTAQFMD